MWKQVFRNCVGLKQRLRTIQLLSIIFLLFILANIDVVTDEHTNELTEDSCSGHSHAMVFHAGVCTNILFSGWVTTNALQLLGSAVVIFMVAVLYEAFKYFRDALVRQAAAATTLSESTQNITNIKQPSAKQVMLSSCHLTQTLLHLLQSTLSYLLMLVLMSYNVWLCLAVLLGLTFGYFIFGCRRSVVNVGDHCS